MSLPPLTRRTFMQTTAAATAVAGLSSLSWAIPSAAGGRRAGRLRLGVIGCGGRGSGAAADMLTASPDVELFALADMFRDRLDGALGELKNDETLAPRITVTPERCFIGFEAYKQLLATEVDVVVLATPPGFRPYHFKAAVEAGKHIFFEKPVAVDPTGVRMVIEASRLADTKNLCIVTGTQRRHENSYLQSMQRIHDGGIGRIVAARCSWNQGGLWHHSPRPEWSAMEWQMRNWLYFTWLSGDHICEQHVHNLDVINWALNATPIRAIGMGGRQVRTHPDFGHIFDHFAVEYEYPGGVFVTSTCRQIEGCQNGVSEGFTGTDGTAVTWPGHGAIRSTTKGDWKFSGDNPNPYVEEHKVLTAAILGGTRINEAARVAESTLTAIMGRMSAYSGKTVTWEQAMKSPLNLMPPTLALGDIPVPAIAVPGKTPIDGEQSPATKAS